MDNTTLNLNPARKDKYFFVIGDIPSSVLLTPEDVSTFQQFQLQIADKNYYNLALKSVSLPSIALGETKIQTMFSPVSELDMRYTFGDFSTQLKMDKDYIIYKLLIMWMILMKHPEMFNQYGMKKTFDLTNTTGIVTILNNFNESVFSLELYELRPISLPQIDLSYDNEGEEIYIDVTWGYSYFMPKKANGSDYRTLL